MAYDKTTCVLDWTGADISEWLRSIDLQEYTDLFEEHSIDGSTLLFMTESDLRNPPLSIKRLGDIKKLYHEIHVLQLDNIPLISKLGYDPCCVINSFSHDCRHDIGHYICQAEHVTPDIYPLGMDIDDRTENSGRSKKLKPEVWKTIISLMYLFIVTWITAFVMVIVHNRVPDMKKYPPLPDIFLDNVPHIPWAFAMCEFTGTLMLFIWIAVLIFHKHRFILLRRFFALSGTVFLLRCVTMLITSLSVPGTHLQCNPMVEELQLDSGSYQSIWIKARHAYFIWRGAGMSIQGVRTCGDYMFSGHTAALTILNFFITEYTPRNLYFMHTFSWILNMFGIFFILSAHEHYSIDVFIAFYITSRLFLYYHTLANNQALMQRDSNRTRIWFPLFSFFESEVDGIVPNEFETPTMLAQSFIKWLKTHWKIWYWFSVRRDASPEPEKSQNPENSHRRMIPKHLVKPLELVVSAIQCLSEEKSWSVQKITKHLCGKYAMESERLKPLVYEGLRRGMATGVLTRRLGLFRLNHALIDSLKRRLNANQEKLRRLKALVKRQKLQKSRSVCHSNCQLHKNFKKREAYKNYKRNMLKRIRKSQGESKRNTAQVDVNDITV